MQLVIESLRAQNRRSGPAGRVDKDVRWFHISVHYVCGVQEIQATQRIIKYSDNVLNVKIEPFLLVH